MQKAVTSLKAAKNVFLLRIFTAEQQQIQSFLSFSLLFPSFNFGSKDSGHRRGKNTEQRNSQIRPVQLTNESTAYNIWAIPCVSGRSNFVRKCVTVLSFLLLNWKQRQSWIFLWQLWNRQQCLPHSKQRTHSRISYRIKAKAFTPAPYCITP